MADHAAGTRLATARIYSGLSVGQAARQTGLPRASIEAWERGDSWPDDASVAVLARVYDAPVALLRDGEPPAPSPECAEVIARSGLTEADKAAMLKMLAYTGKGQAHG